jgi:hypothetical protein
VLLTTRLPQLLVLATTGKPTRRSILVAVCTRAHTQSKALGDRDQTGASWQSSHLSRCAWDLLHPPKMPHILHVLQCNWCLHQLELVGRLEEPSLCLCVKRGRSALNSHISGQRSSTSRQNARGSYIKQMEYCRPNSRAGWNGSQNWSIISGGPPHWCCSSQRYGATTARRPCCTLMWPCFLRRQNAFKRTRRRLGKWCNDSKSKLSFRHSAKFKRIIAGSQDAEIFDISGWANPTHCPKRVKRGVWWWSSTYSVTTARFYQMFLLPWSTTDIGPPLQGIWKWTFALYRITLSWTSCSLQVHLILKVWPCGPHYSNNQVSHVSAMVGLVNLQRSGLNFHGTRIT